MKNIKSYKDFVNNKVNEEEEGWKDIALGTAMAASTLSPMTKAYASDYADDKQKTEISYQVDKEDDKGDTYYFKGGDDKEKERITKTTKSKSEMQKMTKYQGWTLDSTHVDTVWRKVSTTKPDTMVYILEAKLDGEQFFESGRYNLNTEMIDKIDGIFDNLYNEGAFITDVLIESSTDKQGLSKNLQNDLKSKGYTPDNMGLSKARCQSISDYLVNSIGINDTLISTNQLYEKGTSEIDQSARYVNIKIIYIKKDVIATTPVIIEEVPQLKTTYYLSKEKVETKGGYKFKGRSPKTKPHGPIKKQTRSKVKTECFFKN
jgi:outer membrane protein OmpA-like peptidoglycan-associated protein